MNYNESNIAIDFAMVARKMLTLPSLNIINPNRYIELEGYLNLPTNSKAKCKFTFKDNCFIRLPRVVCYEKWIKKGDLDWHIYPDGELCYELPERWENTLKLLKNKITFQESIEYAILWCINSSRDLLYKHLLAFRYDIDIWPKEWDYWGHGMLGIREYRFTKGA